MAARPVGTGRNLTVTASTRLTPTEAETLKRSYGSLPRALRYGLDCLQKHSDPGPVPPLTPSPSPSPSPDEDNLQP